MTTPKKTFETTCEKKQRANNRKTRAKKWLYGMMIAWALSALPSCKNKDSDITKTAKEYDIAGENVKKIEQGIKDKEGEITKDIEELNKDKTELQTLRQNLIDAQWIEGQKLLDTDKKVKEAKKQIKK
jgi:hypothetical protein